MFDSKAKKAIWSPTMQDLFSPALTEIKKQIAEILELKGENILHFAKLYSNILERMAKCYYIDLKTIHNQLKDIVPSPTSNTLWLRQMERDIEQLERLGVAWPQFEQNAQGSLP